MQFVSADHTAVFGYFDDVTHGIITVLQRFSEFAVGGISDGGGEGRIKNQTAEAVWGINPIINRYSGDLWIVLRTVILGRIYSVSQVTGCKMEIVLSN